VGTYHLTEKQEDLLRTIVESLKAGEIEEPIIVAGDKSGYHILGMDKDFGTSLSGDLGALCDSCLMGFDYNSRGNKIYYVRQPGYDAVANHFVLPDEPAPTPINIGAIIHEMTGGAVQAIGFSNHAELQQIVNDPALLTHQVDELANKLLDCVKAELSAERLVSYIKTIEDLKRQIVSDSPSPSVVRRLFGSLAFMGDLEGTISLAARVWPFIYPLLVMVAEKL